MKGQVQMATIKKRSIGVKAAHSQVSPKGTRTLDFHVGAFGQDDGDDSTGPGENTTDWAGLEQAEKEQEELLDEMLSKPALNAKTDALAQKYGVDIDDDEDDDSDDSLLNFDEEKEEEQENPITEKYEKMTKEEVVLDALALREEGYHMSRCIANPFWEQTPLARLPNNADKIQGPRHRTSKDF
mmetsp:Transcript_28663/g.45125  ORF Transcript_28663/g.45125 Transcript_28663/m.45125 type:complete len:184 (+) Transcript_28663:74-625(+)